MLTRAVGRHALLLELADLDEAQRWFVELQARREAGDLRATDLVPGARTVLLDGLDDVAEVSDRLRTWTAAHDPRAVRQRTVEVPVRYDGPDLGEVAQRWGMGTDDAAEAHAGTAYTVAFCGFAPGFAYLAGLPENRAVPRRETPRTRVPAGSVGLAGTWCGVYPQESPGGWALIGRTDLTLFDLGHDPPALLTPGTAVRFVPVP